MFTHPGQTMHNKLAPVIPLVTELLRNSDYHTEIRNPDDPPAEQTAAVGKFLLQQFLPFSIRNLEREMRLGGSTATEAEQFVGMTPAPAEFNQGPAERFVHELEHVKGGEETISQEAAARRELRNELTRALRQAKPAPAAVVAARQAGKLSSGDIHLAVHAAHETPLEAAFAHLPIADALRAYLVADPRERRQLRPALVRKAQAAIKAAPPAERAAEVARLRAALALR